MIHLLGLTISGTNQLENTNSPSASLTRSCMYLPCVLVVPTILEQLLCDYYLREVSIQDASINIPW